MNDAFELRVQLSALLPAFVLSHVALHFGPRYCCRGEWKGQVRLTGSVRLSIRTLPELCHININS